MFMRCGRGSVFYWFGGLQLFRRALRVCKRRFLRLEPCKGDCEALERLEVGSGAAFPAGVVLRWKVRAAGEGEGVEGLQGGHAGSDARKANAGRI